MFTYPIYGDQAKHSFWEASNLDGLDFLPTVNNQIRFSLSEPSGLSHHFKCKLDIGQWSPTIFKKHAG